MELCFVYILLFSADGNFSLARFIKNNRTLKDQASSKERQEHGLARYSVVLIFRVNIQRYGDWGEKTLN